MVSKEQLKKINPEDEVRQRQALLTQGERTVESHHEDYKRKANRAAETAEALKPHVHVDLEYLHIPRDWVIHHVLKQLGPAIQNAIQATLPHPEPPILSITVHNPQPFHFAFFDGRMSGTITDDDITILSLLNQWTDSIQLQPGMTFEYDHDLEQTKLAFTLALP